MEYKSDNLSPNKVKYDKAGIYFYDNSRKFTLSRLIPSEYEGSNTKMVTFIGGYYIGRTGELLIKFLEYNFEVFEDFNLFINDIGISCVVGISCTLKKFISSYIETSFASIEREKYIELIKKIYLECKDALIEAQSTFNKIIRFCINYDNKQYLKELSFVKRYYVYSNNSNNIFNNANYPNLFSNLYPIDKYKPEYQSESMRYEITKNRDLVVHEDGPMFIETEDGKLKESNLLKKVTDSLMDTMLDEEALANKIKNEEIYISEVFYSNILGLLYNEFHKLCILDCSYIKKCHNCGNFFICENRADEIYCNRTINGKLCKNVGYYQKLRSDEYLSIYRTAYNTRNAQLNRRARGKSQKYKDNLKNKFSTWVQEAKEELSKIQKGEINLDDFKIKLNEPIEWGEE